MISADCADFTDRQSSENHRLAQVVLSCVLAANHFFNRCNRRNLRILRVSVQQKFQQSAR